MMKTSMTILVFGIYVLGVGLGLALIPNVILGLFTLPAANEVWVRALGVLAIAVSIYYIQAYRDNNTAYFAMTVWGRVVFSIGIIILAITTPNHLPMVLFAVVDLLGAAWTWYAISQESKDSA